MQASLAFLKLVNHPVKSRLFLLQKLPSAFFSGVRIRHATTTACTVTVPYKWFSTNPFRSTYFACLAMAAELSTGVLAMAQIQGHSPQVSMLVVRLEGVYHKKATGLTTFSCEDGQLFSEAVHKAIHQGEAQTVVVTSTGLNAANEKVATFTITWSFRVR